MVAHLRLCVVHPSLSTAFPHTLRTGFELCGGKDGVSGPDMGATSSTGGHEAPRFYHFFCFLVGWPWASHWPPRDSVSSPVNGVGG